MQFKSRLVEIAHFFKFETTPLRLQPIPFDVVNVMLVNGLLLSVSNSGLKTVRPRLIMQNLVSCDLPLFRLQSQRWTFAIHWCHCWYCRSFRWTRGSWSFWIGESKFRQEQNMRSITHLQSGTAQGLFDFGLVC